MFFGPAIAVQSVADLNAQIARLEGRRAAYPVEESPQQELFCAGRFVLAYEPSMDPTLKCDQCEIGKHPELDEEPTSRVKTGYNFLRDTEFSRFTTR